MKILENSGRELRTYNAGNWVNERATGVFREKARYVMFSVLCLIFWHRKIVSFYEHFDYFKKSAVDLLIRLKLFVPGYDDEEKYA